MPSYVAKVGINLETSKSDPEGTRVEAGDKVDASKLKKKTVAWLLEGGYIEEQSTSSSRRQSRSATSAGSASSEDEPSTEVGDTDEASASEEDES